MSRHEILIKDTHRGLYYEDGVLTQVLAAGRHVIPRYINLGFYRRPRVQVVLVDVRQRDLTIKGQEILTADKVAIRVSIIVQFRVVDPARPCTRSRTTRTGCMATCSSRRGGRWPRWRSRRS